MCGQSWTHARDWLESRAWKWNPCLKQRIQIWKLASQVVGLVDPSLMACSPHWRDFHIWHQTHLPKASKVIPPFELLGRALETVSALEPELAGKTNKVLWIMYSYFPLEGLAIVPSLPTFPKVCSGELPFHGFETSIHAAKNLHQQRFLRYTDHLYLKSCLICLKTGALKKPTPLFPIKPFKNAFLLGTKYVMRSKKQCPIIGLSVSLHFTPSLESFWPAAVLQEL